MKQGLIIYLWKKAKKSEKKRQKRTSGFMGHRIGNTFDLLIAAKGAVLK
jgi:hypothetical protein